MRKVFVSLVIEGVLGLSAIVFAVLSSCKPDSVFVKFALISLGLMAINFIVLCILSLFVD